MKYIYSRSNTVKEIKDEAIKIHDKVLELKRKLRKHDSDLNDIDKEITLLEKEYKKRNIK